ncbi:MAG: hypothetical protein Q9163_001190 [Psora crenata]
MHALFKPTLLRHLTAISLAAAAAASAIPETLESRTCSKLILPTNFYGISTTALDTTFDYGPHQPPSDPYFDFEVSQTSDGAQGLSEESDVIATYTGLPCGSSRFFTLEFFFDPISDYGYSGNTRVDIWRVDGKIPRDHNGKGTPTWNAMKNYALIYVGGFKMPASEAEQVRKVFQVGGFACNTEEVSFRVSIANNNDSGSPPETGSVSWKCCKPRVLTFDEFLSIPPCTTGKHSTIDDTPNPEPAPASGAQKDVPPPAPRPIATDDTAQTATIFQARQPVPPSAPSVMPQESDSDDPSIPIPLSTTCRRRGCNAIFNDDNGSSRDGEECIYHPGQALFHEGSKGWTCCKKRVLEFDEFMKIEGCKRKKKHLFVGSRKNAGREEKVMDVRHDFYQTPTTVIASLFLKKIDKQKAKVDFTSPTTVALDLPTADNKRYQTEIPLFGPIDSKSSNYKVMGTKLELTLVKAGGANWATLRSDEQRPNEIIQVGRAGRA